MRDAITQPRTGNVIRSSKVVNRRGELREKLLAVGARLFVDRGMAKVSVEDLIEAAGISRSTFYGFFANKNELAASSLTPVFDAGIAALERLGGLSARQAADGLVDLYLQLWKEHGDALILTGSMDEPLFPYIKSPHQAFGNALLKVLRVIESGQLLRNGSAELTCSVLARTGIPLLCVYKDHIDFESVYRDSMLALLIRD
jgi:AcrR family transcriptional regulator